uniref:Uncharacterized protein n=1 Tax=Setaria viridis TaxID=4556 RepID=A0A4U6WBG0_SETVI|nr:hypothetical protein SEVIR_1G214350v2 [Setaria viridis]
MARALAGSFSRRVIKLRSGREGGALSRVGVSRHWGAAMWPGGVTWRRGGRGCWITPGVAAGEDNERADRMQAGFGLLDGPLRS